MNDYNLLMFYLFFLIEGIPIPFDPDWEIDRSCLQITDTLGEGAFGVVVKAVAVGLDRCENHESFVAIKMLKGKNNLLVFFYHDILTFFVLL